MSYFAGATIVNAAVFAFLALLVFIKNRESKINRIWAFSNIVISAWFGSIYLGEFVVRAEFVVLCIRSAFSLGLFGTLLLYHFVVLLTERVDRRKKILGVFYSVSFLLVVLMALFPRLVVEGVVERVGLPRVPVGGPLFLAEVIAVLTLMACILCDLFTAYRKATGYRRNQIKYVLLGLFFALAGCSSIIPSHIGINMVPYGWFLIPLYGISISYAVLKYRLMDVDILIGKTLFSIFLLVPVIVLQIILASLLHAFGLGNILSNLFSMIFLFTVLLLTPAARKLQEAANYLAFRGRYDYQKVLKESTNALVAILDLNQLLNYILRIIVDNLGIPRVSLLLEDEGRKEYRIESSFGLDRELVAQYGVKMENGIISYLRKRPRIFIKDEMKRAMSPGMFKNVYGDLHRISAEVVVPLVYKEQLRGILNLDNKPSGQMYNQADLDILENLCATAAVSIENARLYREAITDGLTQLYDHNYIAKRLADELEKARRCKRPLSLLMMDIDHFKQFNDMYGHQLGDVVLKAVAGIIMSSARRGIDVPARYGGEEFALIVPQFWSESPTVQKDHRQDTLAIAERIREHVAARKIAQGDKEIGITISIGVAFFDGFSDGLSSHDVIEQADKALYRAKMEGRNRVCIYAADTQEKSN